MGDSEKRLRMYTIFDHPADYPRHFAVRASTITLDGPVPDDRVQLADSLDDARRLIPPGLTCIPRFPADLPVIVEVWV